MPETIRPGWEIWVRLKASQTDHAGKNLEQEWRAAGWGTLKRIRTGQAYSLAGDLSEQDARRLAERLLTDGVTQEAALRPSAGRPKSFPGTKLVLVWPKDGVADPVGDTVREAAHDLGIEGLRSARSGLAFEFVGAPSSSVQKFCSEHIFNPLVQRLEIF
jgi:phosphoribosylformylglycinamidine (FGAM) synthase PurS component